MLSKLFQWPPQPSTVIGLGVLAGLAAYLATGNAVWAVAAAGVVKVLLPDNSAAPGEVTDAIKSVAAAVGKPIAMLALAVACAVSLSACQAPIIGTSAGGPPLVSGAVLQQKAQDAANIVAGFRAIVPTIATLDKNAADQVNRALDAAAAASASLQSATSGQTQLSAVGEFEAAVNAALQAANALHLSGSAGQVIAAVTTIAPLIETGLNVALAAPAPMPDEATIAAARLTLIEAARGAL